MYDKPDEMVTLHVFAEGAASNGTTQIFTTLYLFGLIVGYYPIREVFFNDYCL